MRLTYRSTVSVAEFGPYMIRVRRDAGGNTWTGTLVGPKVRWQTDQLDSSAEAKRQTEEALLMELGLSR